MTFKFIIFITQFLGLTIDNTLSWKKQIKQLASNLCNKNQLDALFILSLFHQSTSTCSGHICSPSSGGILYIYNNWYVLCFLVVCWLGWDGNKLRINSASSWFSLHGCIEMHSQQNIKKASVSSVLHVILSDSLSQLCLKKIEEQFIFMIYGKQQDKKI